MKSDIQPTMTGNYDSEFCGSIPIQLINLIQAHGMLLVLDKAMNIVQLSENVKEFLHTEPRQLLDHKFTDLLEQSEQTALRKKIESYQHYKHIPHVMKLKVNGKLLRFASTIHIYPQYFILELEALEDKSSDITFINAYQDIKMIRTAMQEAEDIVALSGIAAREIRRFSKFDRVMIYSFDQNWNGTVIAEAQDDNMEHYLNLTFPASDIPRQARELYFKNPYRLVPDADSDPVALFPVVNPIIGGFTDLSECGLRGVTQVHREYLNNMQVKASMSTPIIVDGKLWGLISCHHKTAYRVNFETRYAFEVLSELISSQIAARQRADLLTRMGTKRETELRIIDHIYRKENISELLKDEGSYLLNLMDAEGASLLVDNRIESIGQRPEDQQIWELIKWLRLYNKEKFFVTNSLPHHFSKGGDFRKVASGLVALQFSHTPVAYLLFFRPEIIQTVNWGGNPNEAIRFQEDGKTYHPRNSFKKWIEKVRDTSRPWEEENIQIASNLRTVLVEKLLMDMQE